MFVVYDVTNRTSFEHVRTWLQEVYSHAPADVNLMLVGNKSDLTKAKAVDYTTAKEFADSIGIPFIETSAKTAKNVEDAFFRMAADIKGRVDGGIVRKPTPSPVVHIGGGEKIAGGNSYCSCLQ